MSYKSLVFLLVIFLILGCNRGMVEIDNFTFQEDSKSQWIQDGRALPESDSLFYLDQAAPLFRKEFAVESGIEKAQLFITAGGYYQATLNGLEVGKNVLDPAWTDFTKRIYYAEYDVTSHLLPGKNCLGISLGNGFYNPLPLKKWGHRNPREDLSVGKPTFIASLLITYKDGQWKEIVTDTSWKYTSGPLIRNSVYLGVSYDARKELDQWNVTGYDDASWRGAHISEGPGGKLQAAYFPAVKVCQEISPILISSPKPGEYLVDMGENFTGTYRVKLSGKRGDTISFRFGERMYANGTLNPMTTVIGQIKAKGVGGPGAPEIAWQSDHYIMGDHSEVWFTPPFTYHTYRYMEIVGLNRAPKISDVKGLFIHSDISSPNSFSSSSELLNSIQQATVRTFRANLVSVQSDCAAREKFGYGGDLNATSESFICNFDMQSFYRKTIYDWVDAMKDSSFVDTAPYTGIEYCGISWESAFLITQYYLYLYYNDTAIVKELYELDRNWMDKVAGIHPSGVVSKGLSDHESLEPVPVELTGTAHYLQCARIMQVFASMMGDQKSARQYELLSDQLESQMKEMFWDNTQEEDINRQTLYSTLLYHRIIPEEDIPAATDSLVESLKAGPSGHFITGIFGTKYILETLSEYASPELVFNIVNNKTFPGWGFMIDRGATTIWETWKESDNTYSNCHPMFGSISEWYYRWLGGIRPIPDFPGFSEFTIAPVLPEGLDSLFCTYLSPFGQIISKWKKDAEGKISYELKVPEASTARVDLSLSPGSKVVIQKNGDAVDPGKFEGQLSGKFKLTEGEYKITCYRNEI